MLRLPRVCFDADSGALAFLSQDSQCGTVIDINIECAVKLVGTNCVLYPVNSRDLQHIWVREMNRMPDIKAL